MFRTMLKPGDKLVCIDDRFESNRITLYGVYTFIDYDFNIFKNKFNYNCILVEENKMAWRMDRFITLKEYRKQKLDRIYEKR